MTGLGGSTSLVADGPLSDGFIFATVEPERFDARYHVPRSQVWGGSRGGQRGHVHLHVRENLDVGRIHRKTGQALCGKRGWYERELDRDEIATACPRCAEIERRRRVDP
jgi:hypothetical protein